MCDDETSDICRLVYNPADPSHSSCGPNVI